MPPKAKISKEMIVNAALEIARLTGAENICSYSISKIKLLYPTNHVPLQNDRGFEEGYLSESG